MFAVRAVAAVVPAAIFFTDTAFSLCRVEGPSMSPTLCGDNGQGDVLLLRMSRWSPREYRLGDVVVLHSPHDPSRQVIKRLMAVEGQRPPSDSRRFRVQRGHCWVEGDNQFESFDSRVYGAVPLALIQGRPLAVVWPPSRMGRVSRWPEVQSWAQSRRA